MTKLSKVRLAVLAAAGIFQVSALVGAAHADATLTFSADKASSRMSVSGSKVRIDMTGKGQYSQYIVYDAGAREFTFVFPNDHAYRRMGADVMQQFSAAGGLNRQLTPKWTGGSDKPGGVTCRWLNLSYGEDLLATMCIASQDDLGLTGGEADALWEAMSFGKNSLGNLKAMGITGLPVILRPVADEQEDDEDKDGPMALMDVRHDTVPASTFEVPSGFKQMSGGF